MELKYFLVNDTKYSIKILNRNRNHFDVEINKKIVSVKVIKFDAKQNIAHIRINEKPYKIGLIQTKDIDNAVILLLNLNKEITLHKPTKHSINEEEQSNKLQNLNGHAKFYGAERLCLKSPLTGRVTKIFVKIGDSVNKDNPVVTIESMKMENEIRAPLDAFVKSILISEGNLIQQNQVLITFEKKGDVNVRKFSKQEILQG